MINAAQSQFMPYSLRQEFVSIGKAFKTEEGIMKNTLLEPVDLESINRLSIEQEKKQIMADIKSLQRDLIKASFKQSSAPGAYAELLDAINKKRAKLKKLNQ